MILHKYQALGNDFLIFDCINYYENEVFLKEANFLDFIIKKSDRRRIGCDQFIVMEKSQNADCKIVFYNADGSRAEACGNGTVASSVYASKFLNKNNIKIQTDTQIVDVKINGNEATIELDMPKDLGLSDEQKYEILKVWYDYEDGFIENISVGNPHCVRYVRDFKNRITYYVNIFSTSGSEIENLTHIFPNRTNVEFVTQTGENKFDCFVWERGAGRTFACGTGACAVAFACVKNGLADSTKPIEITMAGSFIYGSGVTPMRVLLKKNTVEFTNSAFFEGEIHC
jgi:diaminopimelate epimerase